MKKRAVLSAIAAVALLSVAGCAKCDACEMNSPTSKFAIVDENGTAVFVSGVCDRPMCRTERRISMQRKASIESRYQGVRLEVVEDWPKGMQGR